MLYRSIQGLNEMLARSYIVAATDYPGLGTPGVPPYLVGISEGRAVLVFSSAARGHSLLPDLTHEARGCRPAPT